MIRISELSRKYRILVLDDEPLYRKMLGYQLRSQGFVTVSAAGSYANVMATHIDSIASARGHGASQ
jgi:CheY-like chemotaxis protein